MRHQNKGQESVEFVLICCLVFIASLGVMFLFGGSLSNFFANNTSAEAKKAPVWSATSPKELSQGSASSELSVDLGNGETVSLNIPNGSYYDPTVTRTTGTSGDTGVTELAQYTEELSYVIESLNSGLNNSNLDALVNAIRTAGMFEGNGIVKYDSDNANNIWEAQISALTDANDKRKLMKNVINSLDDTILQLSETDCSVSDFSNEFTTTDQVAYAENINNALQSVLNDSNLSANVKTVAQMIANESIKVADTYDYTIDNDAFQSINDVITVINSADQQYATEKLLDRRFQDGEFDILQNDSRQNALVARDIITRMNASEDYGNYIIGKMEAIKPGSAERFFDATKTLQIQITSDNNASATTLDLANQLKEALEG